MVVVVLGILMVKKKKTYNVFITIAGIFLTLLALSRVVGSISAKTDFSSDPRAALGSFFRFIAYHIHEGRS